MTLDLERLGHLLDEAEPAIVSGFAAESGFTAEDVHTLYAEIRAFARHLGGHGPLPNREWLSRGLRRHGQARLLPWGRVLVCIPSNAAVPLAGLLPIAYAMAGNQVRVCCPSRIAATVEAIIARLNRCISGDSIAFSVGVRKTLDDTLRAELPVALVHFLGSSKSYADVAAACARAGSELVYEGEGRGMVVVDDACDEAAVERAADQIVGAKAFCNGQMCSAPDVALLPESIYEAAMKALQDKCERVTLPVSIGGLVGEEGIARLARLTSRYRSPTDVDQWALSRHPICVQLAELPADDVGELFAPILLCCRVPSAASALEIIATQRFRLQLTIFSPSGEFVERAIAVSGFGRYCLNMNPIDQDPCLPWGGYGRSGSSSVTTFLEKGYRRVIVEGA